MIKYNVWIQSLKKIEFYIFFFKTAMVRVIPPQDDPSDLYVTLIGEALNYQLGVKFFENGKIIKSDAIDFAHYPSIETDDCIYDLYPNCAFIIYKIPEGQSLAEIEGIFQSIKYELHSQVLKEYPEFSKKKREETPLYSSVHTEYKIIHPKQCNEPGILNPNTYGNATKVAVLETDSFKSYRHYRYDSRSNKDSQAAAELNKFKINIMSPVDYLNLLTEINSNSIKERAFNAYLSITYLALFVNVNNCIDVDNGSIVESISNMQLFKNYKVYGDITNKYSNDNIIPIITQSEPDVESWDEYKQDYVDFLMSSWFRQLTKNNRHQITKHFNNSIQYHKTIQVYPCNIRKIDLSNIDLIPVVFDGIYRDDMCHNCAVPFRRNFYAISFINRRGKLTIETFAVCKHCFLYMNNSIKRESIAMYEIEYSISDDDYRNIIKQFSVDDNITFKTDEIFNMFNNMDYEEYKELYDNIYDGNHYHKGDHLYIIRRLNASTYSANTWRDPPRAVVELNYKIMLGPTSDKEKIKTIVIADIH